MVQEVSSLNFEAEVCIREGVKAARQSREAAYEGVSMLRAAARKGLTGYV